MICPVCGCQQRKTDVCVQCHAPLFAKVVEAQQDPPQPTEEISAPKPVPEQTKPKSQPSASSKLKASSDRKKVSPPPPSPSPQKKESPAEKDSSEDILVTTTQRVEGKRIAKYYGLIHTDVLIEVRGSASAASQVNVHHKRIKAGVVEAMRDLRQEAALLKANAVVATVFDYQRIDSKTLLISVVGTAVFLKDA